MALAKGDKWPGEAQPSQYVGALGWRKAGWVRNGKKIHSEWIRAGRGVVLVV